MPRLTACARRRGALRDRLAERRAEVSILETRLQTAKIQAKLKLGNAKWLLGVLVVLSISGKLAYEALPTELNLVLLPDAKTVHEEEFKQLLDLMDLRADRVSASGRSLYVLLSGSTGRNEEIKLRHFLDRLIKIRPLKVRPKFFIHRDPPRDLRLKFYLASVGVIGRANRGPGEAVQCVWDVPTKYGGDLTATLFEEGIKASQPAYQKMADRLAWSSWAQMVYLRNGSFPTNLDMDPSRAAQDRRCKWGVLLSADDAFLSLVWNGLSSGLDRYTIDKGLF